MRRILFNILAGISLVLAIGVAGLWIHSHFATDGLYINHFSYSPPTITERDGDLTSVQGELWLSIHTTWIYPAPEEEAAADWRDWHGGGSNKMIRWISDPSKPHLFNYPRRSDTFLTRWGFRYEPLASSDRWGPQETYRQDYQQFGVPHWSALVLLLVPPIFWLSHRVRRYRRAVARFCRKCGYDLRATPDRCPECGTAVPTKETISN